MNKGHLEYGIRSHNYTWNCSGVSSSHNKINPRFKHKKFKQNKTMHCVWKENEFIDL